jgi:hypothetical protein
MASDSSALSWLALLFKLVERGGALSRLLCRRYPEPGSRLDARASAAIRKLGLPIWLQQSSFASRERLYCCLILRFE